MPDHACAVADTEQTTGWPDSAFRRALTEISLPAGIVDHEGVLRWVNARAVELFGDQRGSTFSGLVAPESRGWAKLNIAKLLVGRQERSAWRATVVGRDGRTFPAELHTVLMTDGDALAIFGIAAVEPENARDGTPPKSLTPRQLEVLQALARGASTQEIATSLGISIETVRNYVRAILRGLGVHSRLEAVVEGRRLGIV